MKIRVGALVYSARLLLTLLRDSVARLQLNLYLFHRKKIRVLLLRLLAVRSGFH